MVKRYWVSSGSAAQYDRTKSLGETMQRVLKKLLDLCADDKEVAQLVPDIDFFLRYVLLLLEYRLTVLKGTDDKGVDKKIDEAEIEGVDKIGFDKNIFLATSRMIFSLTSVALAEEEIIKLSIAVAETLKEMVSVAKREILMSQSSQPPATTQKAA